MRVVAWILVAAAFVPFVPSSGALPVVEPVALTGTLDAQGQLVLQWTAPLTATPASFTITRTYLDGANLPTSDWFEVSGTTQSWTERSPPASFVAYSVSYQVGGDESPQSNHVVRGPWPHCAIVLFLLLPPPPWYDLQPECLFPLPELPPDAP